VNFLVLIVEQIQVKGGIMGTLEEMQNLIRFVIDAGIKPEIGAVLPMERADEGFRAMIKARSTARRHFEFE
jgi:D-arabinose 1-dehydrogenase-like Zn-dependent alcohol dehydrogenase